MGDGSITRTTPLGDWFPKKSQKFLCGMIWHLDFYVVSFQAQKQ
jgi:hypothetical protein